MSPLLNFLKIGKLEQSFSNKFHIISTLTSCRIEYIGENKHMTQFILNDVISLNVIYCFRIKIIKISNKDILIGVVDEIKQRNKRTSTDFNNAVCYYAYGFKYPSC